MIFFKSKLNPKLLFDRNMPISLDMVDGWISAKESIALYNLAFKSSGPILEIGSWSGKGTISIAKGIKDSGRGVEFNTVELDPSFINFRPISGSEVAFFESAKSEDPLWILSESEFENEILPVLKDGVISTLKTNMSSYGLLGHVNIIKGNFRKVVPIKKYGLIFCDALHNLYEINLNAPFLKMLLKKGSMLVAYGVTNEILIKHLKKYIKFSDYIIIDNLLIAKI